MLVFMSWDILALRVPADLTDLSDLPADYHPPVIGQAAEVMATVVSVRSFHSGPDRLSLVLDEASARLEVKLQEMDAGITELNFWVHSGPDGCSVVTDVCDALSVQAIDLQRGELLTPEGGEASYRRWLTAREA